MKEVFADTSYWIALANREDEYHQTAKKVSGQLGPARIVTSQQVITEFLNYFAEKGTRLREAAIEMTAKIQANPNVEVLPQTNQAFITAFELYRARTDKEYSLTDCASMQAMKAMSITEVLSTDHHFEQAGLQKLL